MLPTWLAMLFLAVGHGFFLPLGPSGLLEGTLLLETVVLMTLLA